MVTVFEPLAVRGHDVGCRCAGGGRPYLPRRRLVAIRVQEPVGSWSAADPQKRPLWLITDKPWDDPAVAGKPVAVTAHIPPLDSLDYDDAFFEAIGTSPIHVHRLDGMAAHYGR